MNKDWVAGSYKKLGDEAAQLLDDVLGTGIVGSSVDDLQAALNGIFEHKKLPDPTKIMSCGDLAVADSIKAFITTLLQKASSGSLSDLLSLPKII